MSASIGASIDLLCKEKNIDREIVIDAMKEAVKAAAKRQFRGEDVYVEYSSENGFELFASKVVVEQVTDQARELSLTEGRELGGEEVEVGDELQLPLPMEEMGRIAAQAAKQLLVQKVREAERANIYEQYIDKLGDLVPGQVKRFERGDIIVDLGTMEALLPRKHQPRTETWSQGERIRVVIDEVRNDAKGPQLIVSRTSPELLKRLFEMEVPEIYDETVTIKSAVREPGERSKIAVASNEKDVDPVGACVGMKGSRVQAIIRELRGEKIDIIEWSEEPSVFAANALSPARVNQVNITDLEKRKMEVIVNDDQLSLAIGKRGQNVRLATKLVGWDIDIKSEGEMKKKVAATLGALIASGEAVPLTMIEGVTPNVATMLSEKGITDVESLAALTVDQLSEMLDTSLDEAQSIYDTAQAVIASRDTPDDTDASTVEASNDTEPDNVAPTDAKADDDSPNLVSERAASEDAASEDVTAEGYDEAVREGAPFQAEDEILAADSADPVALTEVEAMTADELALQGAGRDLQPDTIAAAEAVTTPDETTDATPDEASVAGNQTDASASN